MIKRCKVCMGISFCDNNFDVSNSCKKCRQLQSSISQREAEEIIIQNETKLEKQERLMKYKTRQNILMHGLYFKK